MKTNKTYTNLIVNARKAFLCFGVIALMPALQAFAQQEPLDLKSAKTYGVLAGSTVTTTGNTIVYGDLGISPGTALVGFPLGIVKGAIHLNDAIALQAKTDLSSAYTDAATRTNQVIALATEIGGFILTEGLYNAASIALTTGDLTLDGQNDTNSVWIFQIGSTLNVAASRRVNLINGARAENVFWQVGSSATIGATATFCGTILASQSITLGAGGTFEGRALAITAAVTMDANTLLVADSVILAKSTIVGGPYVTAPEAVVDLQTQTITVAMTDLSCFYLLRASTILTFTGIRIEEGNAILTYAY